MRVPRDLPLFQLAAAFVREHLASPLDMAKANDIWLDCRFDGEGIPVEVLGITGWQMVPDVFLFRVKPSPMAARTTKALWDRLNAFFQDRLSRGNDVLLYISETETDEQRCPQWLAWLKKANARPAERMKVTVR